MEPNVTVFVVERSLSDASKVYDVCLRETVLHAVTEQDAHDLASKIRQAINAHTNDIAGVTYSGYNF